MIINGMVKHSNGLDNGKLKKSFACKLQNKGVH